MAEAGTAVNKVKSWEVLGTGVDHFDLELAHARHPGRQLPWTIQCGGAGECALMFILLLARQGRLHNSGEPEGGDDVYPVGPGS